MRRTVLTIGLLLTAAACSSRNTDSGRQYSSADTTPSYNATTNTPAPVSPPQAGQAGQSSQQARTNIQRQPGGPQALSGSAESTAGSTGMGMVQVPAADQAFMMDAAQGGMAEVQLGRLAEQRGASAQVRDFGRMMVQQHSQANQELTGIAQHLGVTLPNTPSPSATAAQMRLQAAQGSDFDREYLAQQAAGHLEQRALFQFAARNAQTPELRSFAQNTLLAIERHLDQLRTLQPIAMRTGS